MTTKPSVIERAYELAKSKRMANLGEIRRQLLKEGYSRTELRQHLEGMAMRRQLMQLCGTAKAKRS